MEFKIESQVRQSEVDTKNRMRPAIIIELMQEAASQHCDSMGKDAWQMIENENRTWIISRMNIEIVKQIPMYSNIETSTWRSEGKAATYPRNYETRGDGELYAKGYGQWACIDLTNGGLIKFRDFYGDDEIFDNDRISMDMPDKFRLGSDIEFDKASEFYVERHMTDINGHMNNVRYIDPLWSALPLFDEYDVKSFSIHYKHECKKGEKIDIMMSRPNELEDGSLEIFQKVEVNGENRCQAKWILTKALQ